jgi:ATP-binding cassette, subfamily B, bacterial
MLDGQASSSSMRARLELLIGDKKRLIAALSSTSVLAGFAEAALLAIAAQVAATIVGNGSKHVHAKSGLIDLHTSTQTLLIIGAALAVLRLALQWPLSMLPSRIAADVQAGLRKRISIAYAHASWDVQSRDREGQLQEVMTNQTSQATGGALQATSLLTSSINFLILMAAAIALSPIAAAAVFVIAAGLFVALRPLRSLGTRRSRELSAAQIRYAGGIAEANRLAQDTQVFGVADAQHELIVGFVMRCRNLFYRTQVLLRLVPNVYQSLIYLLLIATLWVLHHEPPGHAGPLGAVVLLLMRAAQNGQVVQAAYQTLQQSLPFIDRLENAERRYAESRPLDGGRQLSEVQSLAFEGVSFAYNPGRPVLEDVSFEVQAGEAIGIVGPSGAGKSTLVQILLQLRAASGGQYLVNGEDVREFARRDWQRLVSFVPQEPRLMHASVADNIRYLRDLPDEAVRRAAALARIDQDIASWSDGYETIVGPRADAISGGQQQRICLARALAAHPQVMVLDEPTSALDPSSERLIQESLTSLKSELTMFIIAHRMSTLDMCDRVMVILGGRLAAFDTRAALQESNDYYRRALTIAAGAPGGALPELR